MYSEIKNWKKAAFILDKHEKPDIETSRKMISNAITDQYIQESQAKKLKWNIDQYKIDPNSFI